MVIRLYHRNGEIRQWILYSVLVEGVVGWFLYRGDALGKNAGCCDVEYEKYIAQNRLDGYFLYMEKAGSNSLSAVVYSISFGVGFIMACQAGDGHGAISIT